MLFTVSFLVAAEAQIVVEKSSTGEKIEASTNDAKRGVKKGAHRVEEIICMKGDTKCTGDKLKHRATELKDATRDNAKEIKNKMD